MEQSTRLTGPGREVAKTAAAFLARFLGPDFIERASQRAHPLVSHFWWPGNDVPQVYVRLFELFTRLTLLKGSPGFGRFHRSLRQNLQPANWYHAGLALELGGLALRGRWKVEFEPQLADTHRADLRLTSKGKTILIESLSIGVDMETQSAERFSKRVFMRMLAIEAKYHVDCTGVLTHPLDDEPLGEWMNRLEAAAAAVAGGAPRQTIAHARGGEIIVGKMPLSDGAPKLQGPRTTGDEWARIVARIAEKAQQTATAENLWLRMDELGGLWHFTTWSTMSLQEKLALLLPPVQEALQPYTQISGQLISNAWDYQTPSVQDEQYDPGEGGLALRRTLPVTLYRETMLIGREPIASPSLSTLSAWYAEEATWLDWALERLGHPRLSELLLLAK